MVDNIRLGDNFEGYFGFARGLGSLTGNYISCFYCCSIQDMAEQGKHGPINNKSSGVETPLKKQHTGSRCLLAIARVSSLPNARHFSLNILVFLH